MKKMISIIATIIISCSCDVKVKVNQVKLEVLDSPAAAPTPPPPPINPNQLKGIWTDGSTENASFEIQKDSIYYLDNNRSYRYFLLYDTLKILYEDYTFVSTIKVSDDSLYIINGNGETRFWRFKD